MFCGLCAHLFGEKNIRALRACLVAAAIENDISGFTR